jgi:flagellar biogenesis protein FliO
MFISKNFSFNNSSLATAMSNRTPALNGLRALFQRLGAALGRRQGATGILEHLATLPLGAQSSLVVVRLQGETLLLGATAQRITLLSKQGGVTANLGSIEAAAPTDEARRL